MVESNRQTSSSRSAMRTAGVGAGEIVEVQGGHIVRSTGRKDRHSKVCTAKGPRDRRVRLSAHTAIQFYDVQDRLGYDRPSKAVDWLIKKAKSAIDELAELPAWNPSTVNASAQRLGHQNVNIDNNSFKVSEFPVQNLQHNSSSGFLPPSLDSDAIADTIKSFFPTGTAAASAETPSPAIQFQSYSQDLLSRTNSQHQDLQLSLQSFQDPITIHHHHQHHQAPNHHQTPGHQNEHVLFSGTAPLGGFDVSSGGWSEHLQRMYPPPPPPLLQPLFGENQFFSQRGPLQSSNTPAVRAWIDPSVANSDHHQVPQSIHQSSFTGLGFASGGFSGFHIPTRIQGDEEHDGISDKPSSASSDSRH